jgi:hypothetical protein
MRDGLKGCPYCGTPVEEARLGMRDFAWLGNRLQGRVGPADIDFVLQQSRTNRALLLEFKAGHEGLPLGQRLLLRHFVQPAGNTVWVVWVDDLHVPWDQVETVGVGAMNVAGNVPLVATMSVADLADAVAEWWEEGLE